MLDTTAIAVVIGSELIILTVATGLVIGDLWLLPLSGSNDIRLLLSQTRSALWRLLGICVILFALSVAIELLLRTASMSQLPLRQAYTEIGTVLFKTHYGRLWWWRTAAVLGLAIIWLANRASIYKRRLFPGMAMTAVIIIVISLSASGHAGDNGALSVANIADSLHILGALTWGGGILAFVLVILPQIKRFSELPTLSLLVASSLRLSNLAGIALMLTIFPGIYNALSLVGTWHGLWTTFYGRLLVAKLFLVVAMIALGAINRYRFVPSLQIHAGQPPPNILIPLPRLMRNTSDRAPVNSFLRSLRAEAILLLAVLGMAALLSQEMPAAHANHEKMFEHGQSSASR